MGLIEIAIFFSILYFIGVNSVYFTLLVSSIFSVKKQLKLAPLQQSLRTGFSSFAPSISIIAPAYNEEATVVESVRSFLTLEYPSFEVILVNDGSKDKTLEKMIEAFKLRECLIESKLSLSDTHVIACYKSDLFPKLTVINKVNGGKADSLNVGMGYSKYPLFCAVDSDSLLDGEALLKVATPFLEQPGKVIATGGTVRIANGSLVHSGKVEKVKLPRNYLALMQIVEYTRSFLCGRIGWNAFNSTLVISGAFGLFSKSAVARVGGYKTGSVGEDMELVVRMHKYYRKNKIPYSIIFVADPVCWTEVPEKFNILKRQRDRWQRGLADALFSHKEMIFNPRYGVLGMIAIPYYLIIELFGPLFEVLSFCIVGYAVATNTVDVKLLYSFFFASVLYSALMSISSVLVEEIYFSKYNKVSQFLILFTLAVLENLGYRQLTALWRLQGAWGYFKGNKTWGALPRTGFSKRDVQVTKAS